MQTEELIGTVERVLFHNQENGYAVVLLTSPAQSAVVCGFLASVYAGQCIQVQGQWTVHPKFGKQFQADQCSVMTPTTTAGMLAYLSSGLIKGIGPVYAQRLIAAFGPQVLDVIDQEPARLLGVAGIGEKRCATIVGAWQDQKAMSHIMVFLQEKGVSPTFAVKIYKKYKDESITVMLANPYRLAEDIWGVGFATADGLAQKIGIAHDSPKRCRAGILHCIKTAASSGDVYVELTQLRVQVQELLGIADEEKGREITKYALHELHNDTTIRLITHEEKHYITLAQYYHTEKGIAALIKELNAYAPIRAFDINAIYTQLRQGTQGIELHEDQQRAVLTALQEKVMIITGGPGTGKTTIIKQLLSFLDAYKIKYLLSAPTGRAAKRMSQSTGRTAITIHRLLEFDPSTMRFTRNESDALSVEFLIIDEASMIDIFLAHSLLKAVPRQAHVIFIGDIDQLPSVGAGNFLVDLIASNAIMCMRLTTIFRQAHNSMIVVNAHRVNAGEFPRMEQGHHDFIYIKEEDPQAVMQHITHIYKSTLPRHRIIPAESIVLLPMNRGIIGTQNINVYMQSFLNPLPTDQTDVLTYGPYSYTVGDRVMQIRNNYDKMVFNGDCGTVHAIDKQDRAMTIAYGQYMVEYEMSELDELVLAYAVSIHKSQGSEYDAVIVPLFMQHFVLLQRNLLYTAITRAKKLCILIGQPKAIAVAVKNNKSITRVTFLQQFLTTKLTAR